MVVDYRWLNDCTMVDAYLLPLVDLLLNQQGQNKIRTVLNMKHGYHQMPLDEASRAANTMLVPGKGIYQWCAMSMGVKNGNAQFQQMMEWLLLDLPFADYYVDDIIIGSTGETEEEILANHAKHVEAVLLALEEHNSWKNWIRPASS